MEVKAKGCYRQNVIDRYYINILDKATGSLDSKTEKRIVENLLEKKQVRL